MPSGALPLHELPPADLEAEITFLTPDEDGRSAPLFANCRPSDDFGGKYLNDGLHRYADRDRVDPGDTVRAELWLAAPELNRARSWACTSA